ncbi:PREDICTED: larval cuticle protein 8-like [Rhagoletis zephyria]|uniref:larval cuticle protein 8-like n=1 Tax=Rhagoletis zephyria TaxID=28612 RepID=UPI0008117032|nr:PREDICTED: larval cuticle protein 8-like [Rhagoletis zephyria]XP_036337354.1 larval cuticle protein 65Ag1-like [Rhagoletis pomonella]
MKIAIIVVFAALFAIVVAAPIDDPSQAQILRLDSDVKPDGYSFALETSDGKTHNEEGQLKNIGAEDETIVVRGSFSFVADDGQTYTVNYIADENGFQPEGAHLPNVGIH